MNKHKPTGSDRLRWIRWRGLLIGHRPGILSDLWVIEGILFAGEYNPVRLRTDDIVLDVGANIGVFSLLASRKAKTVISIEPEPENYSILVQNVRRNRRNNVRTIEIAASAAEGLLKISGTGGLAQVSQLGRDVRAATLDRILSESRLPNPSIMKVDVEGYELEVFEGFTGFRELREIIVEVHSEKIRSAIMRILEKEGFNVRDVSRTGYLCIGLNILAHPISFFSIELENRFRTTLLALRHLAGWGPNPVGLMNPGSGTSILYATRDIKNR